MQPVFKTRKSFIQNQSSALSGYPLLFLTILKAKTTEATRSTLRPLESANCTLLRTKWLPCTAIHYQHCLSTKNPFEDVKLTNNEKYQGYFRPTKQNTDLGELYPGCQRVSFVAKPRSRSWRERKQEVISQKEIVFRFRRRLKKAGVLIFCAWEVARLRGFVLMHRFAPHWSALFPEPGVFRPGEV